ncbi:MAG: chemotaxis protein CheX [Vicinamibacterales bacterium]
MSLPRSSSPATAKLLTLLPAVVADVAEQAFFVWAEPCDGKAIAELIAASTVPGTDAGWLAAHIEFRGASAGTFALQLPMALARELGAGMAGAPAAEALADEQLVDVAGELANMLCGALLTRVDRAQQFELLPPQITQTVGVSRDGGWVEGTQFFSVNDRPMAVRVASA